MLKWYKNVTAMTSNIGSFPIKRGICYLTFLQILIKPSNKETLNDIKNVNIKVKKRKFQNTWLSTTSCYGDIKSYDQ